MDAAIKARPMGRGAACIVGSADTYPPTRRRAKEKPTVWNGTEKSCTTDAHLNNDAPTGHPRQGATKLWPVTYS